MFVGLRGLLPFGTKATLLRKPYANSFTGLSAAIAHASKKDSCLFYRPRQRLQWKSFLQLSLFTLCVRDCSEGPAPQKQKMP
jgi:hypothetical protein